MSKITRFAQVWWILAKNQVQISLENRITGLLFISAKGIRLVMQLYFLQVIHQNTTTFANYPSQSLVIFFAIVFLLDILTQVFFRGVYEFSEHIRTGTFDGMLTKPLPALWQALMGKPDINDAIFLIPSILILWSSVSQLDISWATVPWNIFIPTFINGFIIAASFYITILALSIWLTMVDGLVWIHRDLINTVGRYPLAVFPQFIQFFLFFVIPVGFMSTIPAEVFLGQTPTYSLTVTAVWGAFCLFGSIGLWRLALRSYTSASG